LQSTNSKPGGDHSYPQYTHDMNGLLVKDFLAELRTRTHYRCYRESYEYHSSPSTNSQVWAFSSAKNILILWLVIKATHDIHMTSLEWVSVF